jgi:hypothetical protein
MINSVFDEFVCRRGICLNDAVMYPKKRRREKDG